MIRIDADPDAPAVTAGFVGIAAEAANGTVIVVAQDIGADTGVAALLVGAAGAATGAAVGLVDAEGDAVARAADLVRDATMATGATIVGVDPGIGAGAVAAAAGSRADPRAVWSRPADAGTAGVAVAAMVPVILEIGAVTIAADLTGGTGVVASAAVLRIGVELLAFSVAVGESALAPALVVAAFGMIAAVVVALAVLAGLLAVRRRVIRPKSEQHAWKRGGHDADEMAARAPGRQRPGQGVHLMLIHGVSFVKH